MQITGTSGNDRLRGTREDDRIDGDFGDDRIFGLGGNDVILTGDGEDFVAGGDGDDQIGGASFGGGPSIARGAYLEARDGGFAVVGGDVLNGGDGDDVILTGYGTRVDGGNGMDTVQLDLYLGGIPSTLTPLLANTVDLREAATGSVTIRVDEDHPGLDIVLRGIERFEIVFGFGNDVVSGGDDADLLSGDESTDTRGGDDVLYGRGGDDELLGGAGNDRLVGGNGSDRIEGGVPFQALDDYAADELFGDDGDDTIMIRTLDRADGGAGTDTASLLLYTSAFSFAFSVAELLSTSPFALGDGTIVAGIEHFDRIALGEGDDRITGSPGADTISAGDGYNVISGGGGSDQLSGGFGTDVLMGGRGRDGLGGGAGDDWLDGGDGRDVMVGSFGNDTFVVDSVFDIVREYAFGGNDTVRCDFSYRLSGDLENLTLTGDAVAYGDGNGAANLLIGNLGSNTLDGKAGDDRIEGGDADILTGGTGADTFVVTLAPGTGETTTITDFSRREHDRIDVSRIDAIVGTVTDDAFTFIGRHAFSGSAGELRLVAERYTSLVGDVDGDGVGDFTVVLSGVLVVADDLLL